MNDELQFIATEDLVEELVSRADTLVLWYRKANDTTWGAMKGDYDKLAMVGRAVVGAVAKMEDQHPDGGTHVDGTEHLFEQLEEVDE